jgi:hypothetical protein
MAQRHIFPYGKPQQWSSEPRQQLTRKEGGCSSCEQSHWNRNKRERRERERECERRERVRDRERKKGRERERERQGEREREREEREKERETGRKREREQETGWAAAAAAMMPTKTAWEGGWHGCSSPSLTTSSLTSISLSPAPARSLARSLPAVITETSDIGRRSGRMNVAVEPSQTHYKEERSERRTRCDVLQDSARKEGKGGWKEGRRRRESHELCSEVCMADCYVLLSSRKEEELAVARLRAGCTCR